MLCAEHNKEKRVYGHRTKEVEEFRQYVAYLLDFTQWFSERKSKTFGAMFDFAKIFSKKSRRF